MPKKIGNVDRSVLTSVALPPATKTYTVISNSFIINTILKELEDKGFTIEGEDYRCTADQQVCDGSFIINYGDDPDLNLSYSFSNSYDKSLRFRAAVGACVKTNGAYMISKIHNWKRKHTGTADQETEDLIKDHVAHCEVYFNQLKQAKDLMKSITIDKGAFGEIIGRLFINGHLGVDQISMVKKEYTNPSYQYSTPADSLWTCYNHVINALRQSHPTKWMPQQAAVHLLFSTMFELDTFDGEKEDDVPVESVSAEDESTLDTESHNTESSQEETTPEATPLLPGFGAPEVDPDQMDLEDSIAEVKAENEMKPIQESDQEYAERVAKIEGEPEPVTESKEMTIPKADYEMALGDKFDDTDGISYAITREDDQNWYATPVVAEAAPVEETLEPAEDAIEEGVVYFPKDEYPDAVVGVILEVDGTHWEIVGDDPETGAWAATEIVVEEPAPVEAEELPVQPEAEAEVAVEQPVAVDPLEDVEVVAEELPDLSTKKDDPVKKAIAKELSEIYGYEPEFTYTEANDQFNIVLDSGETIVLSAAYIKATV